MRPSARYLTAPELLRLRGWTRNRRGLWGHHALGRRRFQLAMAVQRAGIAGFRVKKA